MNASTLPPSKSTLLLRATLWVLAFSPIILMATLIARFGVDVPRWDGWMTGNLYHHLYEPSGLHWSDFWAQHNEGRLLFPKLIMFGLGRLTHWNTKVEMFLTLTVVFLILAMVYMLFRAHSQRRVEPFGPLLFFLSALALFSPWQREFLIGFQFYPHLPLACILAALFVVDSSWPLVLKFLAAAALCVVSSYSFPHGMIAWLLVGLYAAGRGIVLRRRDLWIAPAWALACGATIGFYFQGYVQPSYHPAWVFFNGDFVPIFLSFLGAPLGQLTLDNKGYSLAVGFGFVLFASYLLGFGTVLVHWRDRPLVRAALPFLLIGAYTLISGLSATAGRMGFGRNTVSLSTRYAPFSTPFIPALIFLTIVCQRFLRQRYPGSFWTTLSVLLQSFLVGAVCAIHSYSYMFTIPWFSELAQQARQGRAALMVAEYVPSPRLTETIFPNYNFLVEIAPTMRAHGLIRPAFDIAAFRETSPRPAVGGAFDHLIIQNGSCAADGWAYLFNKRRPADAVFLTAQIGDAIRPIAVAFPTNPREDLRPLVAGGSLQAGWTIHFPVPPEARQIRAWAVDADSGQIYPLAAPAVSTPSTQP